MRYGRLFAAIMAGLFLASATRAQDYEIRLSRPVKVGFKYKLTAKAAIRSAWSVKSADKTLKEEADDYTIDFVSDAAVLAVNSTGERTSESHKVVVFSRTGKTGASELCKPGDEIVSSIESGHPSFTLNGSPVSRELSRELGRLIPPNVSAGTADDVWGTAGRKRVGDEWPVNTEVMAKDFSSVGPPVTKDRIKGTVRLAGVTKVGDVECLVINIETTMTPTAPAADDVVVEKWEVSDSTEGWYPVDVRIPRLEGRHRRVSRFVGRANSGPQPAEAVTELVTDWTTTRKIEIVK